MKIIITILTIILTIQFSYAKPNYSYTIAENNAIQTYNNNKNIENIKINSGMRNNRAYININTGKNIKLRFNSPKLSNSNVLKLVNIAL